MKWVSNDQKVLESIPIHDRAKDVKELYLTERALGVSWCIEKDKFGFKNNVKEQLCTRCRILSIVSSRYDPLGMVVPFTLPAKLLVQGLCRKGLAWDNEIPDNYLS